MHQTLLILWKQIYIFVSQSFVCCGKVAVVWDHKFIIQNVCNALEVEDAHECQNDYHQSQ